MKDKQSKENKYLFATIGALTERGGRVTTATGGGLIAASAWHVSAML
jgi:hypothetical protein